MPLKIIFLRGSSLLFQLTQGSTSTHVQRPFKESEFTKSKEFAFYKYGKISPEKSQVS